jgi:hypothetical protein
MSIDSCKDMVIESKAPNPDSKIQKKISSIQFLAFIKNEGY